MMVYDEMVGDWIDVETGERLPADPFTIHEPVSGTDALAQALGLAITAHSTAQFAQAVRAAEVIIEGHQLSEAQVAAAKRLVESAIAQHA